MPTDRLLNNVLNHYQDVHDQAKTEQIIGSTTHLLAELSNPLNLSLLTSQLLTASAIWQRPSGTSTALRIISIYNTAAARIRVNHLDGSKRKAPRQGGSGLNPDQWTRAVISGADDHSRRWKHLLVLTGVLMGMQEADGPAALSRSLRGKLQQAAVTAANLALDGWEQDGPLAAVSIVVSLNYVFPLLSEDHQLQINCNAFLPLVIDAFTEQDGFGDGQFVNAISRDISRNPGGKLLWYTRSPSFNLLRQLDTSPVLSNVGPLSKLAAFAVTHATDGSLVLQAQDRLLLFTRMVLQAWQQCSFSSIDPAYDNQQLDTETLQTTWPVLWQLFRKLMFGTVVILQAIVARGLLDPLMFNERIGFAVASKSLQILRNIFFISNRDGNNGFQVYTFTYLTSLDTVARSAEASEMLLQSLSPSGANPSIGNHLQRTLELYYLNIAEHLPPSLSTQACEVLIVKPATSYLSLSDLPSTPATTELFESAHSAILSALSCPQHSQLMISMAPFYIIKLFESFPSHMSTAQFRLAFKTVMQMVSPPFPVAAVEPHLAETLLEMLHIQVQSASTEVLDRPAKALHTAEGSVQQPEQLVSAQSSFVLALIDSLPFLPLPLVELWLSLTAEATNQIADPRLRQFTKERFWDVLVSGEMDVERATIGVAWWGTKGGRELVLFGQQDSAMMSGALVTDQHESRL